MKYEVIDMKIAHSVQATLTIYAHEDYPEVYGERNRPMIVICHELQSNCLSFSW